MVCSGVFVAHRPVADVLGDLEVDDVAILRHVAWSVDSVTRSVRASALGLVRRQASYTPDTGCPLLPARQSRSTPTAIPDLEGVGAGRVETRSSAWVDPEPELIRSGNVELESAIDRAFSEPSAKRQRRTTAVVVLQGGEILSERYAAGVGIGTPMIGWSMSKSVVNALVGILVKEGRITSDGPVGVPVWSKPEDLRGRITLDQLLHMSSGLRFDEDMEDPLADVTRMLFAVGDMSSFAARKSLAADPGAVWHYFSGTSNIIARAIRGATESDREYLAFPRQELFDPLGMSNAVVETDASVVLVGSFYVYATAREWARFGRLYLQDGVWEGRRILPEGWVSYTRSPAPADSTHRFGAHFWLAIPEEYGGESTPLPTDATHAIGHEGQFVSIIPSCDAVVVRLGVSRMPGSWEQGAFLHDVLGALGCSESSA